MRSEGRVNGVLLDAMKRTEKGVVVLTEEVLRSRKRGASTVNIWVLSCWVIGKSKSHRALGACYGNTAQDTFHRGL